MRYGVREICDVVFKAKADVTIGSMKFKKGQPVLYIESAKTSTLEGAATTVYATGGRGNTRLVAWEGEKTLTFTVEDALLSPIGFAILSGAGLFKKAGAESTEDTEGKVYVHATANSYASKGVVDLKDALGATEGISHKAPVFVMAAEADGSITGEILAHEELAEGEALIKSITLTNTEYSGNVFVDFYVQKDEGKVAELQIDAENFAGYYYVEASTLFRRQTDGFDAPVALTLPNVKIQSNFTFAMAATGDPSTFTFTMDALPGYTIFDSTKKVLCVMQVVEDVNASEKVGYSVMDDYEDGTNGDGEDDIKTIGAKAHDPFAE